MKTTTPYISWATAYLVACPFMNLNNFPDVATCVRKIQPVNDRLPARILEADTDGLIFIFFR